MEERLCDSFVEIVRQLQHGKNEKQTTMTPSEPLQLTWARLLKTTNVNQMIESNQTSEMFSQLMNLELMKKIKTFE